MIPYVYILLLGFGLAIGALLLFRPVRKAEEVLSGSDSWAIPVVTAFAFLYAVPWLNYLGYRGMWRDSTGYSVLEIGFVPLEVYIFFLLQPVLTGLFVARLLETSTRPPTPSRPGTRVLGALVFGAFAVAGLLFLLSGISRALYLGTILSWACPLLAAVWAWAGDHLREHAGTVIRATFLPAAYFWVIDIVAQHVGDWNFDLLYALGIQIGGVPLEKAVFFVVTNLLVVMCVLLVLHGSAITERRKRAVDIQEV